VNLLSDGYTWKVWRALKKLKLLLAKPQTTLTLLSRSPNFPSASITRYTQAVHEAILYLSVFLLLFIFVVVDAIIVIIFVERLALGDGGLGWGWV